MDWRRLDVDGIDELIGRGVSCGAGRSEAANRGGDDVIVSGAGNAAGQAVMRLADATVSVTMIVRGDRLALETSIPGLFAPGDAGTAPPSAVGDGAMVVAPAHRRLDERSLSA